MRHIGAFDTKIDGLSTYRKYSSPGNWTSIPDWLTDLLTDRTDCRDAIASKNTLVIKAGKIVEHSDIHSYCGSLGAK